VKVLQVVTKEPERRICFQRTNGCISLGQSRILWGRRKQKPSSASLEEKSRAKKSLRWLVISKIR